MINIDKRLKSLIKYIEKSDKVIDIGCDHALLDIYLIENNIIDNIIISDISKNALNQGINNIKKYNLLDRIDARCGNGLEVLTNKDTIDTIIISGMGSNTIIKILNNDYLNNINKLIIQSNNDYYLLRKSITNLGFYIDKEEVIESNNKLYINIIFIKETKKYNELELKYGTNSMIDKEIYYKYLIDKNKKIINNINDSNKHKQIQNEIEYLESLM